VSVFISVVIANACQLGVPYIFKNFVELFSHGYDASVLNRAYTLVIGLLGVELVTFIFFRAAEFIDSTHFPKLNSHLLNIGHAALLRQEHAFFEKEPSGALARRVTQYAESFETVYERLMWTLAPTVTNIVLVSVILGSRHWSIAALLIIWALAYLVIISRFSLYKMQFDKKRAAADVATNGLLTDTVANHYLVRLLNRARFEENSYKRSTDDLAKWQIKSWLLNTKLQAAQSILMITIEAAVVITAIQAWQAGTLVFSDFVLIQGFLGLMFMNLWNVGYAIRAVYESIANAQSMGKVLLRAGRVVDIPQAPKLKIKTGQVEFQAVTFSYSSKQTALRNFNLTVQPGEKIAFVGPSGAGKSTIGKLLLRLYDTDQGQILIDGQNITQVQQGSLREQISNVPQEPLLFHRSILENIRYARPNASKAEVIAAAKAAQADEFITHLSKGYATVIGERGTRLSGGERQRVALARAFLQNAPIILMDEPTSSLDSISEKAIQKALKRLFHGRTVIVIAHRLATIKEMDRICVIKDGHIVEEGTHQLLTELKRGTYQRLWQIQTKN